VNSFVTLALLLARRTLPEFVRYTLALVELHLMNLLQLLRQNRAWNVCAVKCVQSSATQ